MSDHAPSVEACPSIGFDSADALLPLVYAELRKRAAALMAVERSDHTLQPTALVHEAWLRLADRRMQAWKNRAHFFATAAEAMRWVLVDHARRKRTQRRGGDFVRIELPEAGEGIVFEDADELLALNAALERLQTLHPAKAELVKLRYFAGVTFEEAGRLCGLSEVTAKRHWAFARAWLYQEIRRNRT